MSQIIEVQARARAHPSSSLSASDSTVELDTKILPLPLSSPTDTIVAPTVSLTSYPFPPVLSGLGKATGAGTGGSASASGFSQFRRFIRQPLAEFVGVAVFVFFGIGVDCQVVLSTNEGVAGSPKGDFLSVNFGWAIGLAMGAWISGGISGGHLNPAVTLALAVWRNFSWLQVPAYIFAQTLGALVGSGMVYGSYKQAIEIFEDGLKTRASAGMFVTYALDYVSTATCFFTEFLGTAILVLIVMALTDNKKAGTPPAGLVPLALFLMLLGLGIAFGMQTSYAFNPARDFGPRLLLTFAGYGKQLYTYRNQYWLWCPIIAPFLGAQFAAAFYELFLSGQPAEEDDRCALEKKGEVEMVEVVNVKSGTSSPDERV